MLDDKDIERFEFKVYRTQSKDECDVWLAAIDNKTGYGQFGINGVCRGAHRIALEIKLGRPIKSGMQANHTCDNRWCVNSNHLYEGTQLENIQDAIKRGRHISPPKNDINPPIKYGEENNNCKLRKEQVKEIRELYKTKKITYSKLAKGFNISGGTISQIINNKTWKGV